MKHFSLQQRSGQIKHTMPRPYNNTPTNKPFGNVVDIIRFLWPKYPIRDCSKMLNTPYLTVKGWMCGYGKVPADKCRQLKDIINKRAVEAGVILERQADNLEKETMLRSQKRHFNLNEANRTRCHTDPIEL